MSRPHIVAIAYPAQGHVIPLMEFSQSLANHGIKVSFVNTEYNHKRVVKALAGESLIDLVSLPDGVEPWEDKSELEQLSESMKWIMPGKLEELIQKINGGEGEKVTCVMADHHISWALEVAVKMNIKAVAFWPAAAASLTIVLSLPKYIDEGIVDNDGTILKNQNVDLGTDMPTMKTKDFLWACVGDVTLQTSIFEMILQMSSNLKLAQRAVCNSAHDLEPEAFTLTPEILPIGPLLESSRQGNSTGNFWPQDSTCLEWLDQQPPSSVIYVAFGSFTVFDPTQFKELALGLELSERPFLWVVRSDTTDSTCDPYPEGYLERVASRGMIVSWAPQKKVLAHPSIACFVSHCGWNSTLEGISNGVPILCWPYFADQFINESYICDVWKAGLKFDKNGSGIVTKEEIKNKVEQLLGVEEFKERASKLKEFAMTSIKEGGKSNKNLNNFIEWLKS